MSGAGLVDFLLFISEDLRQTMAQHPWALPSSLVAVFAVGWVAPFVWDAARKHGLTTFKVGVALGGLVLASLVTAIPASSVAAPSCDTGAFTQFCGTNQQAHEECSQRYDDWQKWQRCVERRSDG